MPFSAPVLVVEDDADCRELVVAILREAGYATREAGSAEEALSVARERRPAAVVSDVVLPKQSGYELCRRLREEFGELLPIVLVSGERTAALDTVTGLLIGADHYVTKPFTADELVAPVRRAVIRAGASARARRSSDGRALTDREREVLSLLAQGLSQAEIASRLVISSKTVATHIQRTLGKLNVRSRAEAVGLAYRSGLIDAPRS
jgi:DNA-binding NarL/FixJ family response regulator